MAAFQRLDASARFGFRFLCAAWMAGSAAVLRLLSGGAAVPLAILSLLAACAAFGAGLLWRTRASGLRELVESTAALGFWAGVFSMVV
jgi:hypothetical protein